MVSPSYGDKIQGSEASMVRICGEMVAQNIKFITIWKPIKSHPGGKNNPKGKQNSINKNRPTNDR